MHGRRSGQPVDGGEANPAKHPDERQLPRFVAAEELAERESFFNLPLFASSGFAPAQVDLAWL